MKIKIYIVLLFFIFQWSLDVPGQDHKEKVSIRHLEKKYSQADNNMDRAWILDDMCLYYLNKNVNIDSVFYYADKLIEMGEKKKFPIAIILGERKKGNQSLRLNKFSSAKSHLYKSIKLSHKENYFRYIHDSYFLMSKLYYHEEQLDSALYYINLALEKVPDNLYSKRGTLHTLSYVIFKELDNFSNAEYHAIKAYEMAKKADIRLDKIIALTGLINYYGSHKKDPIKYNEYKLLYDEEMSFYSSIQNSNHTSLIGLEELPYAEKIDFLNSALLDNKKKKYTKQIFAIYVDLQWLLFQNKNYQKSIKIADEAISHHEGGNNVRLNTLIEIYKYKWLAEREVGKLNNALNTIETYQYLKDSLDQIQNIAYVNELNVKYETAINEQKLQEAVQAKSRNWYQRNLALAGFISLLLGGSLLWLRTKNKQLEQQKLDVLQKKKIKDLENERKILSMSAMLEGQEKERYRIAKDLHDGLGGLLSSVKAHFSTIESEIEKIQQMDIYSKAQNMMDHACDEVRRISHNLMPPILSSQGLAHALQNLITDFNINNEYTISTEIQEIEQNTDKIKIITIYRICQELLNNIKKHAQATKIEICLYALNENIQLIIEEDGIGFDHRNISSGLGLLSIESRVESLGGTIDIESQQNKGTTISISIPK